MTSGAQGGDGGRREATGSTFMWYANPHSLIAAHGQHEDEFVGALVRSTEEGEGDED